MYSFTIEHGKQFLAELKSSALVRCEFLDDTHGAAELPGWVKGPKQISDGHLWNPRKSTAQNWRRSTKIFQARC